MLHHLVSALEFDRVGDRFGGASFDWKAFLRVADEEHLTLGVGARNFAEVPESIQQEIVSRRAKNVVRMDRIRSSYRAISEQFRREGVEHVVLKGFSHWPCYVADPVDRPQYDLDLWCRPEDILRARGALTGLGYEPLFEENGVPVDHLPPMTLKNGWQWRGDYFDADMPASVELHFRLWDPSTEHLELRGLGEFWDRRTNRNVGDFSFPALDRVDTVAYAALHFLRHLLRGDFRLYHPYELAHFLDHTAGWDDFWRRWRGVHDEPLRRLQAVAFQLAANWFHCRLPAYVAEESAQLPERTQQWFSELARSPLEAKVRPNKNELWLHLSLLNSNADRIAVAKRRLLPKTHRTRYAPHIPESSTTRRVRWARRVFQVRFTLSRLRHHARALAPTFTGGLRWWLSGSEFDPQFVRFLSAAALFNCGMSVFFLFFNVLLLRRGLHEDMVGAVAAAMSIGNISGTLPGAYLLRRFGLSRVLATAFGGIAAMCALRVLFPSPVVLLGSAFVGGAMFASYAVSIPLAVAQFTTERSRRMGFSIVFASGIGVGVLSGLIGSRLPGLLERWPGLSGFSLETTLLAACAVAALGAIPASKLRILESALLGTEADGQKIYPRDPAVHRMLAALLIWYLATGAFNPFFNVYFVKELGLSLSSVGILFAAGQAVQVASLLIAPALLRRFGAITGLAGMQCMTALSLAALALGPAGPIAGFIYTAYVATQYMSEPGIYSLLMERVTPQERSGTSALNFLIVFGGQALAAAVAGMAMRRFGYRVVLALAGLGALLAGLMMRGLFENRESSLSKTVPIS